MEFFIEYQEILKRIDLIDPKKYSKTRNHKDGAISYLSPFISRGVISTKFVYYRILENGHKFWEAEKFIQELVWRDYWQQVWISKKELINTDLKHTQAKVSNHQIPINIINHQTGIQAIDDEIKELHQTGYMHNHMRMYVASLACNIAKSHWKTPAKWMYYYLLDGDWATNALSWQWVCGANANKKYYANQENVNTFFKSSQINTYLDIDYNKLPDLPVPNALKALTLPKLKTELPISDTLNINKKLPVFIYNYYNLDPNWHKNIEANRILLLEPDLFKKYPVSKKCIDFILFLKNNIPNIQVFTNSFESLKTHFTAEQKVFFKEHPLNKHYTGIEQPRDWIFETHGYFPSFFSFWKKCKKELKLN